MQTAISSIFFSKKVHKLHLISDRLTRENKKRVGLRCYDTQNDGIVSVSDLKYIFNNEDYDSCKRSKNDSFYTSA